MEYAYLSSRAADERSKRPNYRPILDYDSLPSNRAQNQVTSIILGMLDLVTVTYAMDQWLSKDLFNF